MKAIAAVTLLALISLTVPAFAGPVGIQRQPQNQAAIAQLEAGRAVVAKQALMPTAKGPLRFCYMNKQEKIGKLIDRLNNGQRVPQSVIDRTLTPC